ncbi:MAG: DUF4258 domain-containing protein [Anaerolineae bacterium]|nr:DUF4258 domain-containing protein [Anaerolineae bacterium]
MSYRLTDHAKAECQNRGIPLQTIDEIMTNPQQIVEADGGRKIYQSKIEFDGKIYLVRLIVEETDPATVITVYRTSKIQKYWSNS